MANTALARREVALQNALTEKEAALEQRDITLRSLHASQEQLQDLSRRLVEALEKERRTIARELHDEAGQSLTALKLGLGQIRSEADNPTAVRSRSAELLGLADGVMKELHRLAMNLRP